MKNRLIPIIYAFLAAVFYAINTPASKLLLETVPTTFMAAFLYLIIHLRTGMGIIIREENLRMP